MTVEEHAPEPISRQSPPLQRLQMMHQRWVDVTFLHWRVEPARVEPLLPSGTSPDVFDGSSWVGLIAFRMVGAGLGRGPSVPWLGTFAETNVRLYSVDGRGRRGVVFRSLDSPRLAVVLGARVAFGLPYCWARMRVRRSAGAFDYVTRRRWPRRGPSARVVVRPGDREVRGDPLADFLTARWGLHVHWTGRTLFIPNEHEPWPLREATVERLDDELVAAAGLPAVSHREPDSVLWSPGVRTAFATPYGAGRQRR